MIASLLALYALLEIENIASLYPNNEHLVHTKCLDTSLCIYPVEQDYPDPTDYDIAIIHFAHCAKHYNLFWHKDRPRPPFCNESAV